MNKFKFLAKLLKKRLSAFHLTKDFKVNYKVDEKSTSNKRPQNTISKISPSSLTSS